jgi:predicted NAD-dependent protein-ADP-ribosyltransferase YbiA (DUF1768 family)
MVDDMIDGCSEAYYSSSEEIENNKKKAQFAYSYIVQAQKLLEMKQLAECFPEDKYAQAVRKTAEEHLADPQVLRNLGLGEEEKIKEKADKIELDPETKLIRDQQNKMKEEFKGKNFVEANPYDKVWSCGYLEDDPRIDLPEETWPGLNLLGKLLDKLRDQNVKS